ncbi:MAG: hypothetical protein QUS08_00665 [Methanothrix sp.]|nr:hypothetical protein [Methanothrix sp.]
MAADEGTSDRRQNRGFLREVARRVFIEELKASNYSFREPGESGQQSRADQYAPSYLLTPTGARCNRVFIVGTLTEKDDIGGDTEYWRGRLVDPTGSILLYAGQYQPEAAHILAGIEPPCFVAVVGKPNLYHTEDGSNIISIRAEAIQPVSASTRDQWILDAARRTTERIAGMRRASGGFSTAEGVLHAGDAELAAGHYHTDLEHYRQMVVRALTALRSQIQDKDRPKETGDKVPRRIVKGGTLAGLAVEEVEEVPIFQQKGRRGQEKP